MILATRYQDLRDRDAASRDIRRGSVVVLGGLLTSTLLNMVVVPALFMRYGGIPAGEVSAAR